MLNPAPLPWTLDENLRLAILDELMGQGVLSRPDRAALVCAECDDCAAEGGGCECDCNCGQECVCGAEADCDPECACECACAYQDYRYRHEVAGKLLGTPVTADQCAAVRDLHWEAGANKIVFTVWTYWDGESDEFHIRSLEGIAAVLPALESLSVALCAVDDLTPVAGCTNLQRLTLRGGAVTDLGPLAGLGSLRTLELEHQGGQDLRPLTGLPLEHLGLDGDPGTDLAPLEDMVSLRTLTCRRTVHTAGSEPAILGTYDNARVIEVLGQRGVAVTVS